MNNLMPVLFWILIAYLCGSLPSSFIIAKLVKGIDIREHGSGNPGATNVFRIVGPVWGVLTFLIDTLKGFIPVYLAMKVFNNPFVLLLVALAAVAGHMWTAFLNFRGGKGVATGAGIFFALLPFPTTIVFVLFWIIVLITGYVSVGSIIAAAALPVISFLSGQPVLFSYFASVVAALIIFKHRSNIKNLMNGTESKITKKKEVKQ